MEAIYNKVQKELKAGRLSIALDLLLESVDKNNKGIRDELLLLKSKFEYHRNQYEIQGIITDKEFNIHYSKTVLGIQNILGRLQKGEAKPVKTKRSLIPIIVVAVILGASLSFWLITGLNKPKETKIQGGVAERDTLTDTTLSETKEAIVPEEIVTSPRKNESKEEEKENKPAANTVKQKNTTSVNEQKTNTESSEEEKIPVPPEPTTRTFDVKLIMNSDMSDARIFVDGKPATIVSQTPIITTIRVFEKTNNHSFELKTDNKTCKRDRLITENNQKITFNCS